MVDLSYVFATVLFTVYGQLILKWRIGRYGGLPEQSGDQLMFVLRALFDPFIFSGLAAAFLASLFWIAAMAKFDLSYAYPIVVAGLAVVTPIAAALLFGESFSIEKALAIAFIVAGVVLMYRNA